LAVEYVVAGILLFSGTTKMLNPLIFQRFLEAMLILPPKAISLIALFLPSTEIIFGVLLLLNVKTKSIIIAVNILFFLFLVASIYMILLMRDIECGCFGGILKSKTGTEMLIRNILLFVLTLFWGKYAGAGKLNKNNKLIGDAL